MEERPYSRGDCLSEPLSEEASTLPHTVNNDPAALAPEPLIGIAALEVDPSAHAPEVGGS